MIVGVAYGVDRWLSRGCPVSAGSLEWGVKESWNAAGCLSKSLTGDREMMKIIKHNLASNPLQQQPQSPQGSLPRPQKTPQTSLLINICIKILSFSKNDKEKKKKLQCDEIILAHPTPSLLVSRVFLFQGWYLKILCRSSDFLQDNVTWLKKIRLICTRKKWNHSTSCQSPCFEEVVKKTSS